MKDKTVFVCQGCGARSPKWMGRCSACGEWNTLVEEIEEEAAAGAGGITFAPTEPVLYKDVQDIPRQRIAVGIEDFNKVLGGGLVAGLGRPRSAASRASGNRPCSCQVARDMAARRGRLPSSTSRARSPWSRSSSAATGWASGTAGSSSWPRPTSSASWPRPSAWRPRLLVVDSIQTVFSAKMTSGPGTISQVREAANQIFRFAKTRQIPTFLVGHITKDGSLAGPEVPRAHRRRRPPLRGGAGPQPPRPAGHEEPLRARLGAGRLRDDRRRAPAHPQPVGVLPPGAAARGARQRRRLHGQGHPAAPGRDPGPRLARPSSRATRGA
ncbi:MAG: DNA repair protein RadA [Desulfomicrobium escambiense]|nr:DNA repair protein RadA [Desulfomicrobium escambiense]